MLVASCFAALLLGTGQTWVVDDDGPADFTDIASAVAAAAPGDAILVQPGTYASFVLDRTLDVLGPSAGPPPLVLGRTQVVGAIDFELAGLALDALSVSGANRGTIDDCAVVTTVADGLPSVELSGCSAVEVSRTTVARSPVPAGADGTALLATGSKVTLVHCTLQAADGLDDDVAFGDGGDALRAVGSHVIVAGCELLAGSGGAGCSGTCGGLDGDGLEATGGATVFLRGSDHPVSAGTAGSTPAGQALRVAASTVLYSGVLLGGGIAADASSLVFEPAQREPYIRVLGNDAPGAVRQFELFGPVGQPVVFLVSRGAALIDYAHIDNSLWLQPLAATVIQTAVTIGWDVPVTQMWPVPSSLVGLEGDALYFQGLYVFLQGNLDPGFLTTNVANLTYRF